MRIERSVSSLPRAETASGNAAGSYTQSAVHKVHIRHREKIIREKFVFRHLFRKFAAQSPNGLSGELFDTPWPFSSASMKVPHRSDSNRESPARMPLIAEHSSAHS